MSGEFERIERLLRPLIIGYEEALNLSDDAALLSIPTGQQLVVTTDTMVAGVHFFDDDNPTDVALKLLRVNLSDLAAMGANPLWYTLNTALPAVLPLEWLENFVFGLACDQRRYGVGLIGGDSVVTAGPITLSLTAFGVVPQGKALTRRTPNTTDYLFVTGTLGDAALGLMILQNKLHSITVAAKEYFLTRLRNPTPRIEIGLRLRDIANAVIDISDGLVADLRHICSVSGCGGRIESVRIPFSAYSKKVLEQHPLLLQNLITTGDDYELLFSAPKNVREQLHHIARETSIPITEIGNLTDDPMKSVIVLDRNHLPLPLKREGWTHFN